MTVSRSDDAVRSAAFCILSRACRSACSFAVLALSCVLSPRGASAPGHFVQFVPLSAAAERSFFGGSDFARHLPKNPPRVGSRSLRLSFSCRLASFWRCCSCCCRCCCCSFCRCCSSFCLCCSCSLRLISSCCRWRRAASSCFSFSRRRSSACFFHCSSCSAHFRCRSSSSCCFLCAASFFIFFWASSSRRFSSFSRRSCSRLFLIHSCCHASCSALVCWRWDCCCASFWC
mmetsp:Transcript_20679/g.48291  ORF Transcript_20679/g.48291 Transcript_20679/m.48291 type:complete len:231 (-) Transcript_20679:1872-2564(-)